MALDRRLLLPVLALGSFGLAFLQRTGEAVTDTRIELSVNPGLFLERVGSVWSATSDLGHVQSGNFVGYLAPMGPYFAGGDALGVPMWVLQRFWLGALLFLSAWGVVRLMDALLGRRSVAAQGAAALLFVLNPYVVLYASRGTVTLVTYAALPWLMLAAHKGLREGARWRWPAFFGLLLALTPGGVNAAVIAFALVGPAAIVAYELAVGSASRRAAWAFGWRACLAGALGSAWWVVPLLVQTGFGENFLPYTESARTIWGTTSMSELLRLLGFWSMYTGVGFGGAEEPFMGVAGTYLFNPAVIAATFAVPLFGFALFRLTRAWRYGPFFVLLAVLSLLLMFAGFPDGTFLRRSLLDVYDRFEAIQFLRTTYKAAPLLALSLACLGGAGFAALARRGVPRPALAALAVLPVLAALPLFTGKAVDRGQAYGEVPSYWPSALRDADRAQGPGTRTMVLPGELFAWYRWGGTTDPVAPPLSRRPVAIRETVPYADDRSSQLQVAVDDLVQQGRVVPGQLTPLLRLMDVGQLVVAADSRPARSGAVGAGTVEESLARQPGISGSSERYGPVRAHPPPRGRSGQPVRVAEVERRAVQSARPGGVRLHLQRDATLLEGDADGIPELAALGLLEPNRALFYAGDLNGRRTAAALAGGARLVFSDSARRRTFTAPRLRANRGPTLGASDPVSPDGAIFDPFPERRVAGRTTATYSGVRRLFSPTHPGFQQFPQDRAYAAMDGRLDTAWLADDHLPPRQWYVQADLARAQRVDAVTVVPHPGRRRRDVKAWVSVNGGPERELRLRPGPNRVAVGSSPLRSLRVRTAKPRDEANVPGAGGIAEIQVPGVRVRERLRLPTALAGSLRGRDLSRNELVVTVARTTADFPFRAGGDVREPEDRSELGMVDAEDGIERELRLPVARRYRPAGWASVGPRAPDDAIDRLAGLPAGFRFTSSSRFEGLPGRRASSAFDGDRRTAWVGDLEKRRRAFVDWRLPENAAVRTLRLERGPSSYAFPSRIKVSGAGGARAEAGVDGSGRVTLPSTIRGRSLRLEVLAVRRSPRRRLAGVAIAEVQVPGLRAPAPRRTGRFTTACGELRAIGPRGSAAAMNVSGTVADLDAGRPLRLRGCGDRQRLSLPAGASTLSIRPGAVMRADTVGLRSLPPRPLPAQVGSPGRVLAVDEGGPPGAPEQARLDVRAPAWIVLAQSYSTGWRAWCGDGRGGERALGASVAIDGYANGWAADQGCRTVRFAFTPQRAANVGYAISALACLVMLAVLLVGALRRRRAAPVPAPERRTAAELPPDPLLQPGWPAAVGIAATAAVICGGLFALRIGAVAGIAALVLVRVGVNARRMTAIATGLIVMLPLIYIVFPAEDKGGFSFEFATDQLFAHWLAVLAVSSLAVAGVLATAQLRVDRNGGEGHDRDLGRLPETGEAEAGRARERDDHER